MSIRATLATGVVVVATAAGVASASSSATGLVQCGTVGAAGKSWHVVQAGSTCSTGRSVIRQVAAAKPDHVTHSAGGEIDQYVRSFSGFKCFKSRKTGVGGQIQCGTSDNKKTVIGVYKG